MGIRSALRDGWSTHPVAVCMMLPIVGEYAVLTILGLGVVVWITFYLLVFGLPMALVIDYFRAREGGRKYRVCGSWHPRYVYLCAFCDAPLYD